MRASRWNVGQIPDGSIDRMVSSADSGRNLKKVLDGILRRSDCIVERFWIEFWIDTFLKKIFFYEILNMFLLSIWRSLGEILYGR